LDRGACGYAFARCRLLGIRYAQRWHQRVHAAADRRSGCASSGRRDVGGFYSERRIDALSHVPGFAIAAAAGVTLGLLMARNRWAYWFLDPIVSIGLPMPKIAFLPVSSCGSASLTRPR
jgi:ABC-type nitrate/sulfonate/bicarbonate transport system, permease component